MEVENYLECKETDILEAPYFNTFMIMGARVSFRFHNYIFVAWREILFMF